MMCMHLEKCPMDGIIQLMRDDARGAQPQLIFHHGLCTVQYSTVQYVIRVVVYFLAAQGLRSRYFSMPWPHLEFQ